METRLQTLREATQKLREGNDKLETPERMTKRQRREKLGTARRYLELLEHPTEPPYVCTSTDVKGLARILAMLVDEALETAP